MDCQGQHSSLLQKSVNYSSKKFYTTGAWFQNKNITLYKSKLFLFKSLMEINGSLFTINMETVNIQTLEIHNCIQNNRVQRLATKPVNHFHNINWSAFNWKRTDIDAQLCNTLII
jgi:hypothetical protein